MASSISNLDVLQLRLGAPLQQVLEDAAAVAVPGRNGQEAWALQQLIKDELRVLRTGHVNAFLQHVIGMGAAQGLRHMAMQFLHERNACLLRGSTLKRLLHHAAAPCILRQQPHTSSDHKVADCCWQLIRSATLRHGIAERLVGAIVLKLSSGGAATFVPFGYAGPQVYARGLSARETFWQKRTPSW